jgi:hypothetical protein
MVSAIVNSATPIRMKRKLIDIVPRILGNFIFNVEATHAKIRYPKYRGRSGKLHPSKEAAGQYAETYQDRRINV